MDRIEFIKEFENLDAKTFNKIPYLYDSIRKYERERIINIIENCCWKDADMLVELIKEGIEGE